MKNITKSAVIYLVSIFGIFLIIPSCSKDKGNAQKADIKADSAFKVNTVMAVGKTVQRMVEATGSLAPWDEVTVGNETAGTVDKVFADLGDEAVEGKLLLRLDQHDAKANLSSADANLKKAHAVLADADLNLKRYLNLFSEGIVSTSQKDIVQTQYDIADAQLKQAEAQFELAKKQLADTEIRSPISGYVKKRFVSTGEALKDKASLFILVKNDPLKFQGTVPEPFAPQMKAGQDIVVHIDAIPNKIFPGKLIRVSPSIDVQTRALSIEAKVSNVNNILKSGFFARAAVMLAKEDNIPFVPEAAVYSFAGINKVYVIENGAVRERLVKIGSRETGMMEIVEGLKPGDVVATTGLDQLFDGAKVEVK
ncbi:MAG: efflux RND transporter periplasmic adaptor subunit [Deltaproteobacteria bacterium]|nr:efflux RND transporter periplasmic adaptor subunit [Deltaproteobacteria bacterium]